MILDALARVLSANGLITAFVFVGALVWFSYWISAKLTRGQVHGSAIAIMLGLVLAWWGGLVTGGDRGLSDISLLAGVGTLGGAMFRDFAIVATAFGADVGALKKAGSSEQYRSSSAWSCRFLSVWSSRSFLDIRTRSL